MIIENIRKLVTNGNVKWSKHCLEKMGERDITVADVKACIVGGEIIEDYPDDFPYPSCLIYGKAIDGKVIHAVVGSDGQSIFMITAYIPNIIKFEDDLKTRRK